MRGLSSGLLCASMLLASSCGGEADRSEAFSAADSAGIRIATNQWGGTWEVPEWQLEPQPVLSIGDPAPSPEYELHRVYYARSTPSGGVVASVNLTEIRLYDADGKYLRTIGRQGRGPGEFTFLWDAHPLGDSLVRALDVDNRRATIFEMATGTIRSESPSIGVGLPNGMALLADGRYAGLGSVMDRPDQRLILWIGPNGDVADTLALIEGEARPESPIPNASHQFVPGFSSTAAGRWIWAGWEGRYEVKKYDDAGNLVQIIRNTYEGPQVTDEMKQVVLDRATEGSEAALFTPVFPERLPAWNKLLATHSGWLWVRREPPPTETEFNTWDIYDPDGRLAAWIRIPMTGRLSEVGDEHVLGVFRNELDVESIRRYRIVKP